MPLFDPDTPLSEEVAALLRARVIISETTAFIALTESLDAPAALTKLVMGPVDLPWNGEAYTLDENQNTLAYGQLFPRFEESLLVTDSRANPAIPEKEGLFHLGVRRVVRPAEYNDTGGRRDAYLYFLDRTSRMCEQFIEKADLNLFAMQIKRKRGPLFNPKDDFDTQGIYLWADFEINWGGSESAE